MTSDDNRPQPSRRLPLAGKFVAVIPLVLALWLENISLAKLFVAVAVPTAFAVHGYRRNSVDLSGAIYGAVVGFALTLGSYSFLACVVAFFVSASRITKFRAEQKRQFEENFQPGGRRNWIQVLCNAGPATLLALAYALVCGAGEGRVHFGADYWAAWLSMSLLGSLAAACGDTWSSELGSVMSTTPPRLITNLKPVPRGTNGGVSAYGIWFSFVGGLIVGLSYYVTLICTADKELLDRAPAQWPIVLVGGLSGLFGSIIDSYAGAIFQYSGQHKKTGVIVEHPGEDVVHISGRDVLDNHGVNLLSNVAMAMIAPGLANMLGDLL